MSRPKSDYIPLAAPQLRKQSLREQVVKVLKRHIVEASLTVGDKLPPERDLSQGLAVSRTVIREALAALEAQGWVEHRASTGYFVTESAGPAGASSAEEAQRLLHDNLEARIAIELGVAALIVDRLSEEDLANLEEQARELDEAMTRHKANAEAELSFHLSLWAAAQNPVLLAVGRQVLGDFFRSLALARPNTFFRPLQESDARRHIPLIEALRTRDQAIVQAAFREHCRLSEAMEREFTAERQRLAATSPSTNHHLQQNHAIIQE
jgi:GntR family transcriptional repressor for pyruvate dehydrogenase complex